MDPKKRAGIIALQLLPFGFYFARRIEFFTSPQTRKQLHVRSLQVVVNGAMQKAGFQSGRFTAHTLRHSFATHMLNQGNNIHVIKTLLGHSKLETTMIYLHLQHHTQLGIVSPLEKLDDGTTAN